MQKKKILLVDDVSLFLEQEKSMLNREAVDLLVAQNGIDALKIITDERPDLVFMDLYMPGMDGDRVCFQIKANGNLRNIPIVMVIQGGNEEDFERCWQAGCDDIIVKPINRFYFLAVTKRFLNIQIRKAPRFIAHLRVQYQYGDDLKKTLTDYSVNLSTGGIFIETRDLLPVGSPLAIEFVLPENGTIRCGGTIAWVNHPEAIKNQNLPVGMGLQFIGLSLDDMNAIRKYTKDQALLPSW